MQNYQHPFQKLPRHVCLLWALKDQLKKKHLRAASKLTQLRSVFVVLRKLAVIERLAPPKLRTNAASAEETTPTAGR